MAQTLIAPVPVEEDGPRPRLWTREEYHRMAEVGLLPEGPGMELIDGVIYEKMPQSKPHTASIRYVFRALLVIYGTGFNVSMQLPMPLGDSGEPEPDVLVLPGEAEDFDERDPDPRTDVVLAVEVSVSSLGFDRREKAALYARHGVPDYWIVNVVGRTVEVRREPRAEGYAETRVYAEGESVPVGGGTVAVADMLPRVQP